MAEAPPVTVTIASGATSWTTGTPSASRVTPSATGSELSFPGPSQPSMDPSACAVKRLSTSPLSP